MTIFVEQEDKGLVKTEVSALSENFSSFIRTKGKLIESKEGKEYAVLPYVFERIDKSDVYIIRQLDTEFISSEIMGELKNSFR